MALYLFRIIFSWSFSLLFILSSFHLSFAVLMRYWLFWIFNRLKWTLQCFSSIFINYWFAFILIKIKMKKNWKLLDWLPFLVIKFVSFFFSVYPSSLDVYNGNRFCFLFQFLLRYFNSECFFGLNQIWKLPFGYF